MLLSTVILYALTLVTAMDLDVQSKDSVCKAAKLVQDGMWNYYDGFKYGGVVGMFTGYYWWSAGEAFGGILDYYVWCDPNNDTLHDILYDAMWHQRGENYDYIPSNQSMTEGNDDQGVWGLAIMEAVERNFTDPEERSWLAMAQAIFNTMNARWDDEHCGGGLRWQIFTWNSGYNYKNSISNGCLFHIGARLARYLGKDSNMTSNYTKACERVWNWMEAVGFMNMDVNDTGKNHSIYDGANIDNNCSHEDTTHLQWSYTYGIFMSGCAYLWNLTEDEIWKERANVIREAGIRYFTDRQGYMSEMTCAPSKRCNNDQRSFRSLWSRSLQLTSVLIPETYDDIRTYIEKSATGAIASCNGGSDGITCGMDWSKGTWDGVYGLGEQMCALEVTLALLAREVPPPLSVKTGGTSKSEPEAGLNTVDYTNQNALDIKGKDKAGAGVVTAIVLAILLGASIWMLF
ncbi:mannan endo-1,6-alpha-mannosidase Dfg5p [Diutina catenulata]